MASVVEGADDLLAERPQDIEAEDDLGVAWFMVGSSPQLASSAMELITILNRCHRFQGFVYHHARFSPDKKSIEVSVRPRKGSAAICSRCHQPTAGYDQLTERRFEFIPHGDSSSSSFTLCGA